MAKKKDLKRQKPQESSGALVEEKAAPTPPPSAITDRETRNKVLRAIGKVLLILMVLFAMVWGRALYSQNRFYREGEAALKRQNYKDAITGYEWTIRMYTPFSGKVKDSCEKLWQIAGEYEKRGRLDWALIAYRSLRSSIYAVRSFYTPYEEWIPRTDAKIAEILRTQKINEMRKAAGKTKDG